MSIPEIEFPATLIFIGKTKSGKTTALKKLMTKYRAQFDYCYVFTSIKKEEYYDIVNPSNVMGYDKLHIIDKFTVDDPNIKQKKRLIILDNFIGDTKLEKNVIKIFTAGRHNNITIAVLSQYMYQVPPVIRCNASYYFLLKSSIRDLEAIWDIQDHYDTKEEFMRNMRQQMKGYDPILICNFATNDDKSIFKLSDSWFKAKQIKIIDFQDDEDIIDKSDSLDDVSQD